MFTTIIIISISTSYLSAQTIGGSVMLGIPQGEFKEKVDRLGYGFQVHGTLWSPGVLQPFTIGANFGYLIYGEESRASRLSNSIPDVMVDVDRQNSLINFHLLFQVSPFTGDVRPYIEGLFGGAYIFTKTQVESEWSDEPVFESTNFDDFTWSYGGGAGILIKLAEDLGSFSTLFLDLKARFVFGTEAEYLREGDITIDQSNGDIYYNVARSKTDLLTIHIGVVAAM
ncbi:MAG: hypothetical protein A2V66_12535 [Ignavibacteria bacterium RBG_13_36_8]|nr:MAG: hypothetical protein A2V66_12535 [Ignavibacteria bacterium RBG_13_36_8]